MRTLDRQLMTAPPLRLLGGLLMIDGALVVLGATIVGLPKWPDITPERILRMLTGEPLLRISGDEISIANSHVTMWIVMAILIGLVYLGTRHLSLVPGGLQGGLEVAVQTLVDFVTDTGGRAAVKYVPLIGTLFLFILFCNWLGVVPSSARSRSFTRQRPTTTSHSASRSSPSSRTRPRGSERSVRATSVAG